jgi:hypothetical protein
VKLFWSFGLILTDSQSIDLIHVCPPPI